MGLATVNTHEPTGFLKKQNRSQSDQQQAGQSKVFQLLTNQSMIFNFKDFRWSIQIYRQTQGTSSRFQKY